MSDKPLLLPAPRFLSWQTGTLNLLDNKLIVLDCEDASSLHFTASRLQQALSEFANLKWEIVAGTAIPKEQVGVVISVVPGGAQKLQGYSLAITTKQVYIVAGEPAGAFYGVATLTQLLQEYGHTLPTMRIVDWPDFPNRGVLLDISRDKVPTMETLYDLVDMLAAWKINQFQLYTEHTFAYRKHPVVWAEASPMTGEEIMTLDAYCRERFIELVPNQNSFGHMKRWLKHKSYAHLAETHGPISTPWGFTIEGPFTLSPVEPGSIELIRELFDELVPHFSSRQLNVNADETIDLGQGKSKKLCEERGIARVYLDFLLQIYREVKAREHTMQFWGDIIIKHPDLVAELPRDLIALEWGYEANHPFDERGATYARSGVPFYVCPGTSSWVTLAGRTDNAIGNLRNAAENGLKHGAIGYLNTDWGDFGHWQPLPTSYLGFAYGAALSWALEANRELDIAAVLSRYVFRDESGIMGQLVFDLGNIYQKPGVLVPNGSILARVLLTSPKELDNALKWLSKWSGSNVELHPESFEQTITAINEIMSRLPDVRMARPDAELIRREFRWVADMLRHASRRAIWMTTGTGKTEMLAAEAGRLIAEYQEIWHSRNRPGGFKDSVALMEKMKADYLA